jgi:hypothetical protein
VEPLLRNFRLAVGITEYLAKVTREKEKLEKRETTFRANKSAVCCCEDFFETKKKTILTLFLWPQLQLAPQYTLTVL